MSKREWQFADSPNVVAFTTRQILRGEHVIDYVSHDADDGAWQFLARHGFSLVTVSRDDAMLVALS
jgi:hypothetical protein